MSTIEDTAILVVAKAVAEVREQRAMAAALARQSLAAYARLTNHEEAEGLGRQLTAGHRARATHEIKRTVRRR